MLGEKMINMNDDDDKENKRGSKYEGNQTKNKTKSRIIKQDEN